MCKTKIPFIDPQRLPVDISSVRAAMTVWTKSDQIIVGVFPELFPWLNMMNIDLNVTTSRNSAAMASLYQYATS
jgi:hypothetical protein